MTTKWMSRIDPIKADYKEFSYELSELLLYCKDLREPTQFSLCIVIILVETFLQLAVMKSLVF